MSTDSFEEWWKEFRAEESYDGYDVDDIAEVAWQASRENTEEKYASGKKGACYCCEPVALLN